MTATNLRIAKRFREVRGPRSADVIGEKMGITGRRVQQIEAGSIPRPWLYLSRLADDGVDINYVLGLDGSAKG